MHKSGFVNIIGNPNVGKSTLMNALVGEKLSIITSKAQTTRHRIMGIVSGEDFQIVYSDTPGILKPSYKLQESMMKFVTGAVTDADVILYVTDTVEQGDRSAEIIGRIRESGIPTVVVINKIDLSTPEAPRKDPQILRQGDPLLLRNRDRQLQGGTDDRPHRRDDLRRPRLAERHTDRPQGRKAQACGTDRTRGHGAIPRQEGLPAAFRQGKRRLAQQRAPAAPFRI